MATVTANPEDRLLSTVTSRTKVSFDKLAHMAPTLLDIIHALVGHMRAE